VSVVAVFALLVTALAQSNSGDLSALEAARKHLAQVSADQFVEWPGLDQVDAAELEWLELAELAGDL
jgi:hypothetical protein